MKKFLVVLGLAVALCLFTPNESKAQLPDGAFGIGTSFDGGSPTLSGMYSFSPSFDLGLNLGYGSNSNSVEAGGSKTTVTSSQTSIGLTGRYFFVDNKRIDPFFSLGFDYGMADNSPDVLGLAFMFGGQTQIAENFFVYIATGIGYSSSSETVGAVTNSSSQLSFMTSSVGAIVYFK
jgi:hypothetical protein